MNAYRSCLFAAASLNSRRGFADVIRFMMVGAECMVAGMAMADCEECGEARSRIRERVQDDDEFL